MNLAFDAKLPADPQKLRGGYYTPAAIAAYVTRWAIRSRGDRILEPSCGDGNFISQIAEHLQSLKGRGRFPKGKGRVVAVEVEPAELVKAQARIAKSCVPFEWIGDDFFRAFPLLRETPFDVVIGNPPFIRFQHFIEESRELAFGHLREFGYKPTKLANAWAAFVQLSIELLTPGGRLAMVLPAELLQVQYASELRSRLVSSFDHIVLVSFKQLVFPEIQQEVVLLLAEGRRLETSDESDIHVIDITDASDLTEGLLDQRIAHTPARHSRAGMKWTSLYLTERSFKAIDEAEAHPALTRLGTLARVEVGVVTGLNSFFVLDDARVQEVCATKFCKPAIGRTNAFKGIRFNDVDFTTYRARYPSQLLDLNGIASSAMPNKLRDYIDEGEQAGANAGYKCRIRKRWIDVPSIYVPDGFLFRQIHSHPLLVVNTAGAVSTDTIHRVRVRDGINVEILAASFVNSLTFAWAEVAGRSYGGGVLELEPREAQGLPVPYFENSALDTEKIDDLIRSGKIELALDYVDDLLLVKRLGFSTSQVKSIRSAWHELRDRRIKRK